MTTIDLGNQLNKLACAARTTLFRQSELAQLTYGAFDIAYRKVQDDSNEVVELSFPVGWTADHRPISSTKKYSKQELLTQYQFLAINQLASNGILHLVTIVEAMTEDLLRAVFLKYPHKVGSDTKVAVGSILECTSIEAVHAHAVETLLNRLAYKSPAEIADEVEKQMGINLLECGAFHRYMEIKATRDVYIHNRGMANKTYVRKAGQHARVQTGSFLPTDVQYFLESFEQCVQLTEWWEKQLHDKWHSSEYEARAHAPQTGSDASTPAPIDDVSEQLRLLAQKFLKPKSEDVQVRSVL
ncbi:hypothetical protein [Povalibacter sp.]|uniref:hypothetical protein n=1 Tax=Povalibacter sp. TaxID=1962978 RepID=UPI002F42852A